MKYFIDTEFIEDGVTIDLISIGIVCEDNRYYYAVNKECKFEYANDWVWKNVLYPIGIYEPLKYINLSDPCISANTKNTINQAKTKENIKKEILDFVNIEQYGKPEFWGYYADYDWVVFCQLFGTMIDLPEKFPMYCRDIKQLCDELGAPELPKQGTQEHNALADAQWNKQAYEFLRSLKNAT